MPKYGTFAGIKEGGFIFVSTIACNRKTHSDEPNFEAVPENGLKWMPGGSFDMGSNNGEPDELPVHRVSVNGFYLSPTDFKSHPIGEKSSNDFGLFDLSANVWEWCSDWYGPYSYEQQNNPIGPASGPGRVIRGGSWHGKEGYCRVTYRGYRHASERLGSIGFRVARSR